MTYKKKMLSVWRPCDICGDDFRTYTSTICHTCRVKGHTNKESIPRTCRNSSTFISLGGTINRLTPEGIETEIIKGDRPKCLDCGKYKRL